MSTDRAPRVFRVARNRFRYSRLKLVLQNHSDHTATPSFQPELVKWRSRGKLGFRGMIFGHRSAAILARVQGTRQTGCREKAKAAVGPEIPN